MSTPLTADDVLAEMLPWLHAEITDNDTQIGPQTQVIADNLLDSMDLLRLVSHLENRFNISIDPNLIVPENFATPEVVASLIARIANGG